ncbi:uncharacterized protein CLUP02_02682 [Colletotrichum lupini]|uniref:Uncharacterized protein n=1 Tax=Colletotrichum lupini TaxID=145971 RepID=A0A9Q8SHT5_9PEZI|nr:uncharacterized protein CLUP02_02682 [Colletotrichum lupini]UQC77215.1 hypothetical protein CLUP02_02682 [Colletotrichum lupini]
MPSEAQQNEAKLPQPWKEWQAELEPGQEVREGTLILLSNDADTNTSSGQSGNHGTTALQKKIVDLNAAKEKPTLDDKKDEA